MSFWLLKRYHKEANALLAKHHLRKPEVIDLLDESDVMAVALAKRIMLIRWREDTSAKLRGERARLEQWNQEYVEPKKDKSSAVKTTTQAPIKGQRNLATPNIKKAKKHTLALLRHAKKSYVRASSIPNQQNALFNALDDLSVVINLSLCKPPTDVNQILNAISDEKVLSQDDLASLLISLNGKRACSAS